MEITAAAATDVGHRRDRNEDSHWCGQQVFAVADGLGGHPAGDVASAIAIDTITAAEGSVTGPDQGAARLGEAVRTANRQVFEAAQRDPARGGMATTLTVAAVADEQLLLAHVGDSRAYLFRGELTQLTTDHGVGSALTRAVGLEPDVEVEVPAPLPLVGDDQVLLCSDGLTDAVPTSDIAKVLAAGLPPQEACGTLVQATLDRGAPDNVTVVIVRVT